MNVRARDAFIACDLGAMIGLAIAYLSSQVTWQMATIGGGFAAGLIYLFWQYAPRAAAIAWGELFYLPLLWQRILALWHLSAFVKWGIVTFLFLAITWGGWFTLGLYTVINADHSYFFWRLWLGLWSFIAVVSCIAAFSFVVAIVTVSIYDKQPIFYGTEQEKIRALRQIALWCNSITVSVILSLFCVAVALLAVVASICLAALLVFLMGMLVWQMPNACLWAGRIIREAVGFLFTFLAVLGRTTFTFYHRVGFILCTVDTALGIIISYHIFVVIGRMPIGPVLLFGGLLAGLIGALNAEVISKRLLRLVPRNN